jgi:hypothetical protein
MEPAPPLIERLHLYYARHNASKLDSLNAIVAVWATREADLFIALETKYGEAPPLSEGWVAISASVNASRRVSTNAHALVAAPTRGAPSWTAALDAASAPDIPPRSAASGRQQQKGGPRLRLGRLFKRKLDGGSEDAAAAAPAERGAPADLVARSPSLHLPSGDPFDSQVLRAMDVRALERALPVWQRGNDWRLLYSLQRHGAHVGTFIERVKRSNPTLIVLSTGHGEICGAYASEAWQSTAAFCGDGETFLFSCGGAGEGGGERVEAHEHASPSGGAFRCYRWSGANDSFVLSTSVASEGGAAVSFGTGGGSFGLHFGDAFQCCSTARCATFENAPLVSRDAASFAPVHVEAFEIVPPTF